MLILLLQAGFIEEWISRLGDEDLEIRQSAVVLLSQAGEAALPSLVEALRSPDLELRSRAAEVLRRRPVEVSLRLSLRSKGALTTIEATNAGTWPALVDTERILILGCVISRRSTPVLQVLAPGETAEVEVERSAISDLVRPAPVYAGAPGLQVFKLRNVDPGQLAVTLEALFRPVVPALGDVEVAADLRTRSVVVRGSADRLAIVEEVVARLDLRP